MNRAKDLDTIAPDDLSVEASSAVEASAKSAAKSDQISPPKPVKKIAKKKKPSPQTSPPTSLSKQASYRQTVYRLLQNQTKTSFSSFLARPKVFSFDSRHNEEEIILVLRRHWFTNLSWIIITIVMLLVPIFLKNVPLLDFLPQNYNFVFVAFWYLITFAITFEKFISWYFNVFILTEERVIDIDFDNLLYKNISEAKISMIQDVTITQGGVSQTLFNYGSVYIQTASEVPQIEVLKVPNPNLILKIFQQMRGEEEQEALEGRIK
jgi:membrane protein YdbS with pleckstrin-like domain